MNNRKTTITQSTMTNLVGMRALIWDNEGSLKAKAFICGKADEKYYIVQAIDTFTGNPNVAKLMTIEQMIEWTFLPTSEITEYVLKDYYDKQVNRFTFNF